MKWDTKLIEIAAETKYPIGDGDHGSIKPACYQDYGVPYIRVADMTWNGQIIKDNMAYIPEEVNNANPKCFLYPGDIIISKTGATIGKVAVIPDDMPIANTTASIGKVSINPNKAYIPFVYWCMKSEPFQNQLWKVSIKSAQPGFNVKDLKEFKIPLPPLGTQKKIAEILDKADALRKQDKKIIEKYDQLTQSIFLDMFDSSIYQSVRLGNCCHYITKGESPKWQGFDYQDNGILFVTSENVLWGKLLLTKKKYIPLEFHKKLKRSQLEEGNLLINLVGASIGRSAIVTANCLPANINQAVATISYYRDKLNSIYLLHCILCPFIQDKIIGSVVEAARANISLTDLKNLEIPLPPIKLQNRFAEIGEKIENQKQLAQKSLEKSEELFQSFLQRAFKGELV
ncbi:restriction endonuclease subunit S [Desulfobacterota bacterium AH_259_B03_O07]|nr:restriction endonuclease subunit S [Desulfobacterota bacterium AH_259_B03_O07]